MDKGEMWALARRLTVEEIADLRKVLAAETVERKQLGVRRMGL